MTKALLVMWSSAAPAAINAAGALTNVALDCSNEDGTFSAKIESKLIQQGAGTAVNEVSAWTVGTTYAVTKITNLCDNSYVYVKEYINDIIPFLTCCDSACVAPTITTQPTAQAVDAGDDATFTSVAAGSALLTYQWFKDSVAIGGATNASYTKVNAQAGDAGNYWVTITNPCGTITSNHVALTINP